MYRFLPDETTKTVENLMIILGSYCHQARKQCRYLVMSMLEALFDYFKILDQEKATASIKLYHSVWEQTAFQYPNNFMLEMLLSICQGQSFTSNQLGSVSKRYNEQAGAGGQGKECAMLMTCLKSMVSFRNISARQFRECIVNNIQLDPKVIKTLSLDHIVEDEKIYDYKVNMLATFCQVDRKALFHIKNDLTAFILNKLENPFKDPVCQRILFCMAEAVMKFDWESKVFGKNCLEILMMKIDDDTLDVNQTAMYFEHLPCCLIYGADTDAVLKNSVFMVSMNKKFQFKHNFNKLFKTLKLLPVETLS